MPTRGHRSVSSVHFSVMIKVKTNAGTAKVIKLAIFKIIADNS